MCAAPRSKLTCQQAWAMAATLYLDLAHLDLAWHLALALTQAFRVEARRRPGTNEGRVRSWWLSSALCHSCAQAPDSSGQPTIHFAVCAGSAGRGATGLV